MTTILFTNWLCINMTSHAEIFTPTRKPMPHMPQYQFVYYVNQWYKIVTSDFSVKQTHRKGLKLSSHLLILGDMLQLSSSSWLQTEDVDQTQRSSQAHLPSFSEAQQTSLCVQHNNDRIISQLTFITKTTTLQLHGDTYLTDDTHSKHCNLVKKLRNVFLELV